MSSKGKFTAELVRLIGLLATRELMSRYGGQYLYFPETVPEGHPLEVAVGRRNAERLSQQFGGLRLLIPMGYRFELAARNAAIHQARAAGATDAELVRQFHLCPRTICNVLKNPPRYLATLQADPDSPTATQLRLF